MSLADVTALAPFIAVSAAIVVVLLTIAAHRSHLLTLLLTIVGLAAAFGLLFLAATIAPRQVTPLLVVDNYALFYIGALLAAAVVVAIFAYGYLELHEIQREEFYVLLLVATLGAMVLAASTHFASFFLGLEVLSIALYALVGYQRRQARSLEGALKYLVLAATSASFLLFGMALLYANQGTMAFSEFKLEAGAQQGSILVIAGVVLIAVGVGFKLALVPFHMWAPDVYQGSPVPATSLIASASKGALVAVLLRFLAPLYIHGSLTMFAALSTITIASMLAGNILALLQNNIKRLLAYSSIAHLGYVLVAVLAGGTAAIQAATFYIVTYFAAILAAFGVVSMLSSPEREADALEDYRGLYWRHPFLALVLTAAFFSLASIPLTGGFPAKIFVLIAGLGAGLWTLGFTLIVSSAIGLYFYLRVIVVMFEARPEKVELANPLWPLGTGVWMVGAALVVLTLIVVWLGVYPAPLLGVIQGLALAP